MRLFKANYKDRNGKVRQSSKWYIDFVDHAQVRRRMPAFTDKKACEALGRHIEQLVCCKVAKEPLNRELTETISQLPQSMKDYLLKIGLMDNLKNQAGRPLLEHLEDFKASLKAKGNTTQHIKLVESRAKRIITDCGFVTDVPALIFGNFFIRIGLRWISAKMYSQ